MMSARPTTLDTVAREAREAPQAPSCTPGHIAPSGTAGHIGDRVVTPTTAGGDCADCGGPLGSPSYRWRGGAAAPICQACHLARRAASVAAVPSAPGLAAPPGATGASASDAAPAGADGADAREGGGGGGGDFRGRDSGYICPTRTSRPEIPSRHRER